MDKKNLSSLAAQLAGLKPEESQVVLAKINEVSKTSKTGVISKAAAWLAEKSKEHGFSKDSASCEFKGSQNNQRIVKQAIVEKYDQAEADKYQPVRNVTSKTEWAKRGFVVVDGEEPLCFIPTHTAGRSRNVAMWHINQMVKS